MIAEQAVVTSSEDWKNTGQKVAPLRGRQTSTYYCTACARRFVWHSCAKMPSHIDPYTGTWCESSGSVWFDPNHHGRGGI